VVNGRACYPSRRWNSNLVVVIPSRSEESGRWLPESPPPRSFAVFAAQDDTDPYCRNSGGSPFIIFPNLRAPNPFENDFIIFFICRYCFSRRLMS
jgi:hypothetical protein